MYFREKY
ncbi:hypothetical protein YPPY08_1882, partial [Yersinia pestis PY-08]